MHGHHMHHQQQWPPQTQIFPLPPTLHAHDHRPIRSRSGHPHGLHRPRGPCLPQRNILHLHRLPRPSLNVTKASVAEFPALEGQSVSLAFLEFPGGAINPPHTHPRAAELLFLLQGTLEVTVVDTKGAAYAQLLRAGDMFVFPKGLLHLQYNKNHKEPAVAVSAFAGVNAGTVSVPKAAFGAGIDDLILAKAFNTDVATVQKIKSGLANP